jgi:hypothetical protein
VFAMLDKELEQIQLDVIGSREYGGIVRICWALMRGGELRCRVEWIYGRDTAFAQECLALTANIPEPDQQISHA